MDEYDLKIQKGIEFIRTFQYSKVIEEVTTPKDITGCSLFMKIRHTPLNPTVLFQTDSTEYLNILNPNEGTLELRIPKEITKDFNFTFGKYEILIEFSNGSRVILITGNVNVVPLINRN